MERLHPHSKTGNASQTRRIGKKVAAPLQGWDLPPEFAPLHRLLEALMAMPGKRGYVQVLRLLETFEMEHVHGAVRQGRERRTSPSASALPPARRGARCASPPPQLSSRS